MTPLPAGSGRVPCGPCHGPPGPTQSTKNDNNNNGNHTYPVQGEDLRHPLQPVVDVLFVVPVTVHQAQPRLPPVSANVQTRVDDSGDDDDDDEKRHAKQREQQQQEQRDNGSAISGRDIQQEDKGFIHQILGAKISSRSGVIENNPNNSAFSPQCLAKYTAFPSQPRHACYLPIRVAIHRAQGAHSPAWITPVTLTTVFRSCTECTVDPQTRLRGKRAEAGVTHRMQAEPGNTLRGIRQRQWSCAECTQWTQEDGSRTKWPRQ